LRLKKSRKCQGTHGFTERLWEVWPISIQIDHETGPKIADLHITIQTSESTVHKEAKNDVIHRGAAEDC